VIFNDRSTSGDLITNYEWNMGDGTVFNTDSDSPFTHTYENVGEYYVSLIVTTNTGCIDTSYAVLIEVGENITPSFAVDKQEVCIGDTVNFENLTDDPRIDAFHFETDEGRSFHCANEPVLSWVYETQTGSMDVSLTVGFNGCYTTYTEEGFILVKGPIAHIDYEMDCDQPFDFMFRDSSDDATSVTWNFGDGNQSTQNDLTHTYDTTGNYTVILTAENNSSGCPISSDTAMVFVKNIQADFVIDSFLCQNETVSLDASSSIDVHADCWRGFTWFPSFQRPITTQDTILPLVFPESGMQEITLVVTDINGCRDTIQKEVEVLSTIPQISVPDETLCFPAEVPFTDATVSDTSIIAWEWDLGDGNFSTLQNPIHTYLDSLPETDTIIAVLKITNALGCEDTVSQIFTYYYPESSIIATATSICVDRMIDLSATDFTDDGSNLTFNWDFGNGQVAAGQSTSVSFDSGGIYEVQLIFEEVGSGCVDTIVGEINVQDFPEADFITNLDSLAIICYPENVLFTNTSTSDFPIGYFWDFGNGQTSNNANPLATFDKGTFDIMLVTSTNFSCRDTIIKSLTFVGPKGDFELDSPSICVGQTVNFNLIDTLDVSSYSWDFGDGTGADDISPINHQYNFIPPGNQTVAKLVLRGFGDACTIAIEYPIEINQVTADFFSNDGVDSILCVGEITFSNGSQDADIFNWDFGDGNFSNLISPTYTYDSAGVYVVELLVENSTTGCKDSLLQQVTINPLPAIEIFPDTICQDEMFILDILPVDSNYTYLWSPADVLDNPNIANPTATLSESTTFVLMVADENDCENMTMQTFDVFPEPPSIAWDTIIGEGASVQLPFPYDPSTYTYIWNTTVNLSCENCANPIATPSEYIVYSVTVTDKFDCHTVTYTFEIDVFPEKIEIPNAFTPNGDNINDIFNFVVVDGEAEFVTTLDFRIYNRWGEKVYDNDNPEVGWDGTYNDEAAPSEVYMYILEVSFITGKVESRSGDVTLIR